MAPPPRFFFPFRFFPAFAALAVGKLALHLFHIGQQPLSQKLGILTRLNGHDTFHNNHLAQHLFLVPVAQLRGNRSKKHMGQNAAVERGDQSCAHVRTDIGVSFLEVHSLKHID